MAGYSGTTIVRFEISFTNLGNTPQTLTMDGSIGRRGFGPWARGKILFVSARLDSGPATLISFDIIEQLGGVTRLAFLSETLDAAVQPAGGPVPYQVADSSKLELRAVTDDGTFNSDVTFFIDIEGPF